MTANIEDELNRSFCINENDYEELNEDDNLKSQVVY